MLCNVILIYLLIMIIDAFKTNGDVDVRIKVLYFMTKHSTYTSYSSNYFIGKEALTKNSKVLLYTYQLEKLSKQNKKGIIYMMIGAGMC